MLEWLWTLWWTCQFSELATFYMKLDQVASGMHFVITDTKSCLTVVCSLWYFRTPVSSWSVWLYVISPPCKLALGVTDWKWPNTNRNSVHKCQALIEHNKEFSKETGFYKHVFDVAIGSLQSEVMISFSPWVDLLFKTPI